MKRPKANKKKGDNKVTSTKKSSNKLKKQNGLNQVDWKIWLLLGVVVFLIFAVLVNVFININANAITGMPTGSGGSELKNEVDVVEKTNWDQVLRDVSGNGDLSTINPVFPTILKAIFGSPVNVKDTSGEQDQGTSALSAIVLTICAWLLVFLTFSDIIGMFSSFSKGISWVVGFILATILAQFNWQMRFIILLSKILNITGTSLVFIGLLFSFLAFALLNLGIFPVINRLLIMRKASMTAHKAAAGGKEVTGAITALKDISKELAKGK